MIDYNAGRIAITGVDGSVLTVTAAEGQGTCTLHTVVAEQSSGTIWTVQYIKTVHLTLDRTLIRIFCWQIAWHLLSNCVIKKAYNIK